MAHHRSFASAPVMLRSCSDSLSDDIDGPFSISLQSITALREPPPPTVPRAGPSKSVDVRKLEDGRAANERENFSGRGNGLVKFDETRHMLCELQLTYLRFDL